MDDCRNCGNPRGPRSYGAHGYCDTCYRRWAKAGKPASGPPDPKHNLAARMEDLGFLLSVGVKDNDELARRLELRVETVRKYRKVLEDETASNLHMQGM